MRKALSAGALVLGLFALVVLTAGEATSSQTALLTIRLISINGPVKAMDRPPKGPSKGDVYAQPSVLRNAVKQFGRATGAVVGHDYEVLTMSSATTGIHRGVASLPGGTIRVRGYVNFKTNPNAGTVTVIGGTGRYANARGTEYIRDLSTTRSLNVYHLRIA